MWPCTVVLIQLSQCVHPVHVHSTDGICAESEGKPIVGPKDNHTLSQKYVQVHMVHSPGARDPGPRGPGGYCPDNAFWEQLYKT